MCGAAGKTVAADVPAGPVEHAEASGGESRDAAHLRAGDEPEGRILR